MESATHILGAFAARRSADEGLFDRAIRGDAVAFSEVYRRYEKRVYGFCLARSLDREAAADATQEVFIRLLKAAPGSIDHPRAWLFTVARNVATDAIRRRIRSRETGEADEGAPAWESLAAGDTADEVSTRADARTVFLALRRVNPRYRTALILREIHGQSSADIAEAMGVRSTGAVDTLVSRARDAFGAAYAAVSELSQACRRNVELTYRARGTGITAQESDALHAHLASCERCRREDARADDPKRLSALLPLLVPAGGAARSLLGRAVLAGRSLPDISVAQHITELLQTHLHTVGSRIAAGVLAATLVVAPVVAIKAMRHDSPRVAAGVAHANPASAGAMAGGLAGRVGVGSSRAVRSGSPRSHNGPIAMARTSGSMPGNAGGTAAAPHGSSMKYKPPGAKRSGAPTTPAKMPAAGTTGGSGMPSRSGK
jgi:RNA polymerase sigma-70 factor (ECF subfamily)